MSKCKTMIKMWNN